jgi:hypothetical protein
MTETGEVTSAFYTIKILKNGCPAAKQEVIARLFMECSEDFVKKFVSKVGEDKFYAWMPLA